MARDRASRHLHIITDHHYGSCTRDFTSPAIKQQYDGHGQGGGHSGGLQGLEPVGEQQHGSHHSHPESPDDAKTPGGGGGVAHAKQGGDDV